MLNIATIKIRIQTHNYLDFLIDQSFQRVNRLFVLACNAIDNRKIHSRYYLPNARVEDCIVVIDRKNFFDQPIKNYIKTSVIQKIATGQGDDYINGWLPDYNYYKKHQNKIKQ